MPNYPYRSNYKYSTPVRAKASNLLGALFAGLGAGGETTVEDEARRRLFIAQHPELQSNTTQGPLIADPNAPVPTFQRPKSNFRDFFSGGAGSAAANRYNAQSLLNYDDFVRAKALADYERAQELANIPKVAKAKEDVARAQAPIPIQPGEVPFNVSDPEAYISQFGPYYGTTSAGLAANERIRTARILGANAANAQVLANANIINQEGVPAEVASRINPSAVSTLGAETRARGQAATEAQVTSKQRTGKYLREPSFIPRGMEVGQAIQERNLESPDIAPLRPGANLINGQIYTVSEGIDPTTGSTTTTVTDANGNKVRGVIPLSNVRRAATYKSPQGTTTTNVESRITAPFDQNLGTAPAEAQIPRATTPIAPRPIPTPTGNRANVLIEQLRTTTAGDPVTPIILLNLGYSIEGLNPEAIELLKAKVLSGQ